MSEDAPTPELLELQRHLEEATRLADDERWAEAFELLHEEEPRHPDDPTLLCMLGVVSSEMEARSLAYDYFRRCLAQQPTDPYLLVTLGAGLARFDDPDAEGVFRLAALTAPDLPVARLQYGSYLAREGMLDAARAELEQAMRLEPENGEVRRELAIVALLANDVERGLDELQTAMDLLPDEVELRVLYGLALLRGGRAGEAAEELHRAGEELTQDGELQLATALALAGQEWWDHAWDALARAEIAELSADPALVHEVEEALAAGPDESQALLTEQVAPALLHDRLFQRP